MAKSDPVKEYLATIGARGGSKKVEKGFSKATAEERSAAGKKGALKRWGKKAATKSKKADK